MMGHGSPRLQDGQGQSQDGQSSTRSQDSDLDSQTRRLVAQVTASLEEGHRLVPTTAVPTTIASAMLDTPEGSGARAGLPLEYQVYTAEQARPSSGSAHAHAHAHGGPDEAQSNRVIKLSGHIVTQAQTRSDEQYVQQQQQHRREQLQQHQQQMEMRVVPQNIVHDYSRTGLNAPASSTVARQQSMYAPPPQQQQRGVQYEGDVEVSQRHPPHHAEGKHPWALQRVEGQSSRIEWSGEMLQGRGCHQSDRTMHSSEGKPQEHYQPPNPRTSMRSESGQIPGGPSLLQRRISRSEFVQMYSSDDRYPNVPPPPPNQAAGAAATSHPESSPGAPEVLPEKVDSPISYVSEWLCSSTVWGGEGGYGTPTTADMERESSRFVYPPPSKLLTDSTPRQHHEEVCISHQDEDSNVIRSFLHEQQQQQQQQQQQVKNSQHDSRAVQLTQQRPDTRYDKMETAVDRSKDTSSTSYPQRQFRQDEMSQREHSSSTALSQGQFFESGLSGGSGEIHHISKKEQTVLMAPRITLEQCEPMMTQQLEGAPGSPSPMKGEGDTQQLPVRNLKISSPKSTHAARRASSPVVSKPAVPFFWHFHSKQNPGTTSKSSYTLSVKEQVLRRYSDSNIPMEPEDLRIKPAIRSKSTGDSTSYEEECLASEKVTDSNLLSVAACKTAAAAKEQQQPQGPDDKNIITKRLKLKTYLQNRYEADKEEKPSADTASEQTRMSTASVSPEPETQSRMSVSKTSGSQRSMSLQSESERKITKIANVHVSGSLDEGLLRGSGRRHHESPEKTHLTRAIESWNLPHPITIKVEPVSPFPSEDDPETPGSVFTPGINVPATPTSFLSPGAPGGPRQIFSFNVPTCREISSPNQRHPRRPLMAPMYQRHEKSASLSSLTEKSLPPPPSPSSSHISLPTTHHDQRHYSDTVIYTEHKPSSVRDENDKPKDQPVDMRRSPPCGRKQPPPPLQLASMSTFSHMEDQPMPSPGAPMLPPPRAQQHQHISEFLATSAPAAGLRSPAFPFSTLPSHLHSHPGSSGYHHPMLSPGPMTWSTPPSAALLPQQSPRHPSAATPVSGAAGASGGIDVPQSMGDSPQRMLQAGAMSHPTHSQHPPPQIVHPQHTQHSTGRKGQQNLSKLTLTSMAAIQQLREQQLREGTLLRDPNLTYMCPVCGQLFPSYNYLANHMVNHLPSETVIKGPGENKLHLCKVVFSFYI